jgi:predicted enzyme related to lactoylglutathione lyase
MKRVTGIGGIFIKAKDPDKLREWYRDHLGIDCKPWGGTAFLWKDDESPQRQGVTIWSVMPMDSSTFNPSAAPFMVNYRVQELEPLLAQLRKEGCTVDDRTEESAFGKFGWVMDPEGNRIELWEPPKGSMPE